MTNINPIKFEVTYNKTFSFTPEDYLEYCETYSFGEEPTQEGFEQFCRESIFDEVTYELDLNINKVEE